MEADDRAGRRAGEGTLPQLPAAALQGAASLGGIGLRAGHLVVGLSAVRRTSDLALVLLVAGISPHTRRELASLVRRGVRVFQVDDLEPLAAPMGRPGIRVLGIKAGPFASGMARRLGVNLD